MRKSGVRIPSDTLSTLSSTGTAVRQGRRPAFPGLVENRYDAGFLPSSRLDSSVHELAPVHRHPVLGSGRGLT